jgi:hypothetical protein
VGGKLPTRPAYCTARNIEALCGHYSLLIERENSKLGDENMGFDLGKLKDLKDPLQGATEALAAVAAEKSREFLAQANLLLQLLQSAGYGIGSLEVELSVPPKITIKLKTGPAVKEEKLAAILREQADKKLITGIVASLIQANKLRDSVTVETLELGEVQIILATPPNITMHWNDRTDSKATTAVA